jgi:hypothetical protein
MVLLALMTIILLSGCSLLKSGSVAAYESIESTARADTQAVDKYELTAVMLKEIHDNAVVMCDAKALTAKQCADINVLYQETRQAFIEQGDRLKDYILVKTPETIRGYINARTAFESLFQQLKDRAKHMKIKFMEVKE